MGHTGPMTIRVFLLDDHEIVRRGIADLLSLADDMEVVGEAGTATDALHRMPAARPDVAVLDVRLPDGSGVEVCRDARALLPDLRCLMLTSYSDDEALFDAIMAGAAGYVLKDIKGNDLVEAVRSSPAVAACWIRGRPPRVLARLRDGTRGGLAAGPPQRPGAAHPRADRRGHDQPPDRRVDASGREDREELRVVPAGQAGHGAPHPGRRLRSPPRRGPQARSTST